MGQRSIQVKMHVYGPVFEWDREWVAGSARLAGGETRNPEEVGSESRLISRWKIWWRCPGLNGRPAAYESAALPTELHRQKGWYVTGRYDTGMIWRVSTVRQQ